jgi:hypothetical protein
MIRGVAYVAIAIAAIVASSSAAAPAAGPGVRNAHGMVFDVRRGVTVMFGGADASRVRDDTWSWDGRRWVLEPWRGPGPRTFPAMVWDAARGQALLFGGRRVLFGREEDRNTFLGDTWALGRQGWRPLDVSGPSPRAEAAVAFDAARGVVVLFGGYNDNGGATNRLGDTWEWNGSRWTLRATDGPAPRNGAAMTWDPKTGDAVLFGGSGGPRADTWAWNGVRWRQLTSHPTPGRFNSVAAFDAARGQIIRTTGWNGRERVRDTWVLSARGWELASSEGPPARNHSALTYDSARARLVLFGGHDGTNVFGDVWEWDGVAWRERFAWPSQRRVENGH